MKRKGDWIQTFSGRPFWPLDPRPEDISLHDIAHALSMKCRYGGHCLRFYSVAEHSVLLSQFVPEEHALWALLHDASEAYSADIPRPLKKSLTEWKPLEDTIMQAVCQKFGLSLIEPAIVKTMDLAITTDERQALMAPSTLVWDHTASALGAKIQALDPMAAKSAFLQRFFELTSKDPLRDEPLKG